MRALAPYIAAAYLHRISVATALLISVGLTVLALMVFGFIKGRFTGTRPLRSALQTALIGSAAAGVRWGIEAWVCRAPIRALNFGLHEDRHRQ